MIKCLYAVCLKVIFKTHNEHIQEKFKKELKTKEIFKTKGKKQELSQDKTLKLLQALRTISQDTTHPLHQYFIILSSEQRYKTLRCNKEGFKNSLIPSAIYLE